MHHLLVAQQMERNAETIRHFVAGIGVEQAHWKPTVDDWSMVEVINHLYDEEREDFRQRIDYVLHRPGEAWPPIYPGGWVTERHYNQRMLTESVADFIRERQQSIYWLSNLSESDWDKAEINPAGFSLSAGDLLASWLAHDYLHLRQLCELHYRWVDTQALPKSVRYAGDW